VKFNDDAELVVVLSAGDAGAVCRRPNLDEEDRRAGKRRQLHHEILHDHGSL
jgi:hypothetical protein